MGSEKYRPQVRLDSNAFTGTHLFIDDKAYGEGVKSLQIRIDPSQNIRDLSLEIDLNCFEVRDRAEVESEIDEIRQQFEEVE